MKRRTFLRTASAAPLMTIPAGARAADNVDNGTVPDGALDVVARFTGPGPSGIAVLPNGRIFVGFPRHADNHDGATLGELKNGKVVPYPSAEMSLPSDRPPAERLLSVHGMTVDTKGRLWLIDDGKLAGHAIPDDGAKIVCIDPASDAVVHKIVLNAPVRLPDSHMNDLRVTLSHGTQGVVFVTDSSFGTQPGLVVADIASGRVRRVLTTHPSAQPVPGFMAFVEGEPRRYVPHHPGMVSGGIDGIALTPDEQRLFYAPLTSRRLYSLPTASLADFGVSDHDLGRMVRDEGEKGTADGLCFDRYGRLYTTDYEHDSILRRDTDGTFRVMLRDPRVLSPDGIFATRDHVYCTLGQWNRLASFNEGRDLRRPPYLLVRVPVEEPSVYDAGKG